MGEGDWVDRVRSMRLSKLMLVPAAWGSALLVAIAVLAFVRSGLLLWQGLVLAVLYPFVFIRAARNFESVTTSDQLFTSRRETLFVVIGLSLAMLGLVGIMFWVFSM